MHPSTALARVLVDELVRQGVQDVVLAPGSRSAPFAFALHDAAEAGRLRLHVRIDERSAAFLALGLIKGSPWTMPAAVVTTSGTAVANLHPAVLEASHSGLPLIVVTADRPPELRGVGANQTTEQVGIFGSAVRLMTDLAVPRRETGQVQYWRDVVLRACVAARGTRSFDPGPVHLNVGLTEPLVPAGDDDWIEPLLPGSRRAVRRDRHAGHTDLPAGRRTVVLAGDGAGPDARWLAETAGWPLLAEPSSGARSGPNAIAPYRLLLDKPGLGADIERVVMYGHPTLSRPVSRLLARDGVELVVVTENARWPDPARRAHTVLTQAGPPGGARSPGTRQFEQHGVFKVSGRADPDAWLSRWLDAAERAGEAINQVLAAAPLSGQYVAAAIAAQVPPGGLLFVGSSNPIRDLDLTMAPYQHPLSYDDDREEVRVLANRGLAGIDGTVSSAIGAALSWQYRAVHDRDLGPQLWQYERHGPAYALLGDLTFLHDSNGLVIGPEEARPNLVLVVLNDDGGGIFSTLEPGAPDHAASFERIFGTPHCVDLAALCAGTRTEHELVRTAAELDDALSRAAIRREARVSVIEARVERTGRRALELQLVTAVAAAIG